MPRGRCIPRNLIFHVKIYRRRRLILSSRLLVLLRFDTYWKCAILILLFIDIKLQNKLSIARNNWSVTFYCIGPLNKMSWLCEEKNHWLPWPFSPCFPCLVRNLRKCAYFRTADHKQISRLNINDLTIWHFSLLQRDDLYLGISFSNVIDLSAVVAISAHAVSQKQALLYTIRDIIQILGLYLFLYGTFMPPT